MRITMNIYIYIYNNNKCVYIHMYTDIRIFTCIYIYIYVHIFAGSSIHNEADDHLSDMGDCMELDCMELECINSFVDDDLDNRDAILNYER